jgi:hypothetical protein
MKLVRVCVALSVASCAVLPVLNVLPALAESPNKIVAARNQADIPTDIVVTEAHITLLKSTLNLRPEQMPYWTPVETALQEMARWQATPSDATANRPEAAVVARLKRIAALAAPLIKVLDEGQRNSMMILARSAGLEQLLAAN